MHTVLRHLADVGFEGAPRVLGHDERGREMLTYLAGETVGEDLPWPDWVRSDDALRQVGQWLRRLHDATAAYVPPRDAIWLGGQSWRPGLVVGHHDAAPYNAVWRDGALVGFVDWDTAGPSSRELDLAFAALTWVPLQTRDVVERTGFTAFDDRSRRLHLLLDAYGYDGDRSDVRHRRGGPGAGERGGHPQARGRGRTGLRRAAARGRRSRPLGQRGGGAARVVLAATDVLSVEVAPCQEADLVHLVARLPTPGHPQRHAARFARQQSGQSTFLIAWSAGLPVGAGEIRWRGCAAPEVLARFPECPELNGLDVWPPELRSHGIGTALVRAAEGEVRSRGGGQLGLGVEDGNVLGRRAVPAAGLPGTGCHHLDRYHYLDESGGRSTPPTRPLSGQATVIATVHHGKTSRRILARPGRIADVASAP